MLISCLNVGNVLDNGRKVWFLYLYMLYVIMWNASLIFCKYMCGLCGVLVCVGCVVIMCFTLYVNCYFFVCVWCSCCLIKLCLYVCDLMICGHSRFIRGHEASMTVSVQDDGTSCIKSIQNS